MPFMTGHSGQSLAVKPMARDQRRGWDVAIGLFDTALGART